MLQENFAFFALLCLSLSVFNLNFSGSGVLSHDVEPAPTTCLNCTICPYPCHTVPSPPPPLSVEPSYEAPPPPEEPTHESPPPPPPPPPAATEEPQANCTTVPVQCCYYPPPGPPPNTDIYQPYENLAASSYAPLLFVCVVILPVSFAVMF